MFNFYVALIKCRIKSTGHDKLNALTIKTIALLILKPVLKIFNESFATGIIPTDLKIAKV